MRLLLINPNTSTDITDLVLRAAMAVKRRDTDLVTATGRFGGRYIATRATYAIAGHAALDAWAQHHGDADGIVLACFGDPGLDALKELSAVPVVGMVEATVAATGSLRFSIVTGGVLWQPMLRELVTLHGAADRLASIRTVAPSGADIARDPEGSLQLLADACRACADQDGAETVILGGAGLAGLTPRLQPLVPVPLIDGVATVIAAAEAAVAAGHPAPPSSAPRIASVGLAPALAAAIGNG